MKNLLALFTLLLLTVGVTTAVSSPRAGPASTTATPTTTGRVSLPTVRWVVRAEDLLVCRTPSRTLRHLQSQFGTSAEWVILAVGMDEEAVRSFMRIERIKARVIPVSERSLRTNFAQTSGSGLYLLSGEEVVMKSLAGQSYDYAGAEMLTTALQHAVSTSAPERSESPIARKSRRIS